VNYRVFLQPRSVCLMGKSLRRSRWMSSLGNATLNRHDLSGAIRGIIRGKLKSQAKVGSGKCLRTGMPMRSVANDVLRVVKGRRDRKGCIRLIIKKKSWKRMDK
jgi:hypothetical protein